MSVHSRKWTSRIYEVRILVLCTFCSIATDLEHWSAFGRRQLKICTFTGETILRRQRLIGETPASYACKIMRPLQRA